MVIIIKPIINAIIERIISILDKYLSLKNKNIINKRIIEQIIASPSINIEFAIKISIITPNLISFIKL